MFYFLSNHNDFAHCGSPIVTCEAGTTYPSGAPEFTPVFSGVSVGRSLVFCVVFWALLFVLFILDIAYSALHRLTASNYPFGIFKLFLSLVYIEWRSSERQLCILY